MRSTFSTSVFLIPAGYLVAALLLGCESKKPVPTATISEEKRLIKTYPFSDPNPVPQLINQSHKIYPYYRFDGYSHTGQPQEWKVVTLENDHIAVTVMPEVGGKVFGAIEKSTGKEFVYTNHVLKFRNIALRGPWSSGGIEFNFGLLGHSPWVSTPVDYVLKENADGSVSAIVGTMDITSRTQWRVEINLQKDKAYLETKSHWFNPRPVTQAYYSWINAAAKASDDLEFLYPGNKVLDHPGDNAPAWPITEKNKSKSWYKNNAHQGDSSYHVVGEYRSHFGGYWHDEDFGFGHWARYDEMPGSKLWLWSQARYGAIWEDLLTDNSGQYIEYQSGRLFNQLLRDPGKTTLTDQAISPVSGDQWNDIWFPVKDIGGFVSASPVGTMNVSRNGEALSISINALQNVHEKLRVIVDGKVQYEALLTLDTMQVFKTTLNIPIPDTAELEVIVGNKALYYTSKRKLIDREFVANNTLQHSADQRCREGTQARNLRLYQKAKKIFETCLQSDQYNMTALVSLAELSYREAQFELALKYAKRVLALDNYHGYGNYYAGISYMAKKDWLNAKETLGWAARSLALRSASYSLMAEIAVNEHNYSDAEHYANKSLNYDRHNINALKVLAVKHRLSANIKAAMKTLSTILTLDPLSHFVRFEHYYLDINNANADIFNAAIRNEMPQETYLELAMEYVKLGLNNEAIAVLNFAPKHAIVDVWLAYLQRDSNHAQSQEYLHLAQSRSPYLVFPFRIETIAALTWAQAMYPQSWKFNYYLGLTLLGKGRGKEAAILFEKSGNKPDYAPFYLTRAALMQKTQQKDSLADLEKALHVDTNSWRNWLHLIAYHDTKKSYGKALTIAEKAHKKFPENYIITVELAISLFKTGNYSSTIDILSKAKVLPIEHGGGELRKVYEQSYLMLALASLRNGDTVKAKNFTERSEQWPENLGLGKPFRYDYSIQQYLLAVIAKKTGNQSTSQQLRKMLIRDATQHSQSVSTKQILALNLLKRQGKTTEAEQFLAELSKIEGASKPVLLWLNWLYKNDFKISAAPTCTDEPILNCLELKILSETLKLGSVL